MNLQALRSETGNLDLRETTMRLVRRENLSRTEGANFLDALLDPAATDAQIAAALVALTAKGETVEELAGMAEAMGNARHACIRGTSASSTRQGPVQVPPNGSTFRQPRHL